MKLSNVKRAFDLSLIAIIVLIIIQFTSGMWVNLNVIFPANALSVNATIGQAFSYVFSSGFLSLVLHASVGILICLLSILILLLSVSTRDKLFLILAVLGLISSFAAAINGIRFAMSDFTINGISFGMAMSFLFAFLFYVVLAILSLMKKPSIAIP